MAREAATTHTRTHTRTHTHHCENSRVSEAPAPQVSWRSSPHRRTWVLPCSLSPLLRSPRCAFLGSTNARSALEHSREASPTRGTLEGWRAGYQACVCHAGGGGAGTRDEGPRQEGQSPAGLVKVSAQELGLGRGNRARQGSWHAGGLLARLQSLGLVSCAWYKPGGKSPGSRHLRRRGGVCRVRRKVVQGLGWRKVQASPGGRGGGPDPPKPPLPSLTQSPPGAASATVPVTLTQILLSFLK